MSSKFQSFWTELSPEEKTKLAERADTSVGYLSQVANGHRGAGTKTIASLVGADPRVSLSMFFEAT